MASWITDDKPSSGGGGGGGDPTSFLFNPDGTQAGNVYNDWGDLDAALQAAPGRRTVYLASEPLDAFGRMVAEVPAGSYDWSAVGFSTASNSLAGATLRVGDGVTITNMDGLRLEGLVTLEFVNDAGPVATLPASTRWGITLDLGTIVAKGDAVPISMPNASSFIGFILDNEAGLIRGTTPQGNTEGTQAIVNSADASNGIFVTMGLKSWATDNLFTGTVGFFAYRCGSTSVNPATIANAGLTVSYNGSALITYAANLAYDNTDSGLAAGNVQAAIDEIVVSPVHSQEAKYGSSDTWGVPGDGYANFGSFSPSANTFYPVPFVVSSQITVTAIAAAQIAGAAAGNMRLLIYAADVDWQATGAALLDTGSISTSTNAVKSATGLSVVLAPGRYLRCLICDVGGTSYRVGGVSRTFLAPGIDGFATRWSGSVTYGAPSSPAWTTQIGNASTSEVMIGMRWTV